MNCQLVVTGAHLSHEFGFTVRQIEADGFSIAAGRNAGVERHPGGVAKSIGLGVIGMSDALADLRPDVAMVLGDRLRFSRPRRRLVHNIPLAHIAGGDTTEGAFDESIRHAITKMAHVHLSPMSCRRAEFASSANPHHIHVVGSPGLDHLRRLTLLDRPALERALEARLTARNLLVTFHPVTLDAVQPGAQLAELLRVGRPRSGHHAVVHTAQRGYRRPCDINCAR